MISQTHVEGSPAAGLVPFSRELEICAETLKACAAAELGGADRIELCSGLSEGGVTPSHGFIRAALAHCKLPIHVLLRPRAGNFVYSEPEFSLMCEDLEHAASLNVAGFVAGCLNDDGKVDELRLRTLVRLAGERPVTFHRAFDHTPDLEAAFETIVAAGCKRLLTSGGRPNVTLGISRLAELTMRAAERIRIAAGGGVTLANAPELCRIDYLDVHASLRIKGVPASGTDSLWDRQTPAGMDISAQDVHALAAVVHGVPSLLKGSE